ncbi:MAG: CPBP family intramembrane metalloprotease [Opitutales bacterium]|nr:CPBP family intramembrane metalloprotease [Opitutales bacterium]
MQKTLPFPLLLWGIFFVGSILVGIGCWIFDFFSKRPVQRLHLYPLSIRWYVVLGSGGMFFAIPWILQKTSGLQWLPAGNPIERIFWFGGVVECLLFLFFLLLLRVPSICMGFQEEHWLGVSIAQCIRGFLKSLPLVFLVAALWIPFLMGLKKIGLPVTIEFQPIMQYLMKGHVGTLSLCVIGFSAIVLGPICEEIFFRGILLRYFCTHLSRAHSVWLSSIIFAIMHRHMTAFLPIVAMGYWLGWLYMKTQNLMVEIVVHGMFNAVSFAGAVLFAHFYAN